LLLPTISEILAIKVVHTSNNPNFYVLYRGKMSQIGLEQQSVVQFSEECYLDYSMYVVLERALLFVGDCQKQIAIRDLCINRDD
jgi:hypothetical protein